MEIGQAAPTTTGNGAGQHPLEATFQTLLDTNSVRLGSIALAKVMASPHLTADEKEQAIGEQYYPLLLAAFQKKHKGVQIAFQEDVGVAIVLHTAEEGDPEGDKLDYAVIRKTLRFDWAQPREVMLEVQELADEGRRWLKNPRERRDLLGTLYGVLSQLTATIGRENRICSADQDESVEPSSRIHTDVNLINRQVASARRQFEGDIERAAQFRYVAGMVVGTLVMFAVFGIVAWILAEEHIPIIHAVGIAAGAVGACVSVLQRMTRGKLDLEAQSGDRTILALGALRPVVGGIFGLVTYLVIQAELISIFVLPKKPSTALAYIAVFAFIAGFNERFAQDVLANASNTRSEQE